MCANSSISAQLWYNFPDIAQPDGYTMAMASECYTDKTAKFLIDAYKLLKLVLVDEIWYTLSTTVLECVHELIGYISPLVM